MKILHIIISILLMSNFLLAQTPEFDYEYGDISQDQLEMTVYDKDSTASAVLLLNYCKVYCGDYNSRTRGMFYKYHYRIKVLDKSKFKRSDIKLFSTEYHDIQSVKAQSINLKNGTKQITKVEDFFEKEIGENGRMISFAFPAVQDGSILEYQYIVFQMGHHVIRDFYFQSDLPHQLSEYHVAVPEDRGYSVLFQGDEKPVDKGSQAFVNKSVNFNSNEYYWVFNDVPSMREESYTSTLDNYLTKVRLQLSSENVEVAKESSNGIMTEVKFGVENSKFMETWTDLGNLYFNENNKTKINELYQIRPVLNKVGKILKNSTTRKDSILTVYNYVKENMDWNRYYSIGIYEQPKEIFRLGTGMSSEINFTILSLFYQLEIEAYPILLSSRSHGRVNMKHPFINQFSHTIIAVNTGEEWLFLDAIDKSLPYDLLPIADLNYEGLLINNDTSYFINIPFEPSETVTYIKAKLDENGTVSGILNLAETNYIGAKSRQKIYTDGKTDYQNNFFKDIWTDAKATDIQFKNLDDKEKRLNQTVTFEAKNVGQVNGELMYLDIFMGLGLDENPFQLEKRNYPVELPYPLKETILLNIEIPDGYMVESLPEPVRYNLPNGDGSFTFAAQEKNNVITISSKMSIQKVKFEINEYEAIKGLFETLVEKQAAQVVLKKQ